MYPTFVASIHPLSEFRSASIPSWRRLSIVCNTSSRNFIWSTGFSANRPDPFTSLCWSVVSQPPFSQYFL
uniref:Uncharacterized protein n=1 Tax=Arundo donax TaxID=35708 RepID=A0A0A9EHC3_ARUDO